MSVALSIDYGRHDDMGTPRDPGDYAGKHRDRGLFNPGPYAYMGVNGSLYRAGYHDAESIGPQGYATVYRAEYGLAATMIENGEVFE